MIVVKVLSLVLGWAAAVVIGCMLLAIVAGILCSIYQWVEENRWRSRFAETLWDVPEVIVAIPLWTGTICLFLIFASLWAIWEAVKKIKYHTALAG
jgi:ABC-type dipeptide/oligopeptide/nickel transport system permease component